jgi:spore germination cell wall hydrolase CwlJ-like protein
VRLTLLASALLAGLTLPAYAAGVDEKEERVLVCLAEAVYFEAHGTTDRGALAVANVVNNRVESEAFPGTICGVVADGCQFSYRCDGRPEALTDAEERGRAFRAAEAVLSGDAPDPTDGALFFHSDDVDPGWFASRPRVGEIAGNVYYR